MQQGGTLRIALDGAVATLDPHNATDANSAAVARQIFETLVDVEPGGRVVGRLAESWTASRDGRTWTFSLRRGVRFHDGSELDALAVVASFDRGRLPGHPLRGAGGADRFRAFAALWGGFGDASVLESVDAKDARTVVFTTRAPYGPFLAALAAPGSEIVSPASLRADPLGWAGPASGGAAGTGPFAFRPGAWQADGRLTLERNPAYWQRDAEGNAVPYLDRLQFRVVPDEASRVAELRSGAIDLARDVSASSLPAIRADPKLEFVERAPFAVVYLGLDRSSATFAKVEARRAVAAAVDERTLASATLGGAASPAAQAVAPGILGHDDTIVDFARLDAGTAKRLLADAGHPQGATVDLRYAPGWRLSPADARRVAEAVAADLTKIGITATPRAADASTFRADAAAGRFTLWIDEVVPASADPDAVFGALVGVEGPVVSELLRQARAETDGSKRGELYKQVSKLVQHDVLIVPLVHPRPVIAFSGKVRGVAALRDGSDRLTAAWIGR